MPGFLPIFLNVDQRPCLVVGGGEVAARKVRQLLRAGGSVRVVAPDLNESLQRLLDEGRISHEAGVFDPDALADPVLVIAATDDPDLNAQVSGLARARQIPVNVVDNPALCSFIMPSIVDRDPVQVAISTGGASPVLARLLRARLETMIPSSYGRLADLMQEFRHLARQRFPGLRLRRRFWETVIQGPVAEMLFSGQERQARRMLKSLLEDTTSAPADTGEVYLVGGGPGDPDLLTFRALRLLQQAEVILYDRLVAPAIVDLARKDAERIYVGKERDRHALTQEEITALLIKLARDGKRVLRLKGGDPFIFGRGGEEIDGLAGAGVPFQVVPGITAASGCSSYAGIPLTHREYAHSCIFVTGHMQDGDLALNWEALVQPFQTIAVYMGVKGLDTLSAKLMEHRMRASMPAAIIEQGTLAEQRVFVTDIEQMAVVAAQQKIQPPSMVIIGDVVKLHEKLAWFQPVV